MAATLPKPLNKPPQTRGEYRGRNVDVSGSVMRATMLFPTSFAPLPKARTNNTPSPRSAVRDISGAHYALFRRTRSTITVSQRLCDDICRGILSVVLHKAGTLLSSHVKRPDECDCCQS